MAVYQIQTQHGTGGRSEGIISATRIDENAQPQDFDVDAYLNMRYKPQNLGKSTCKVSKISCEHLGGSVYVNSLGQLFPCCYHGFGHVDRPKVLLEKFADLKKTWTTDYCDEICAGSCGAP